MEANAPKEDRTSLALSRTPRNPFPRSENFGVGPLSSFRESSSSSVVGERNASFPFPADFGDARSISCAKSVSAFRKDALNSTSRDSSKSVWVNAPSARYGNAKLTLKLRPTSTALIDLISNATNASAKENTFTITSCAAPTLVTLCANARITAGSGLNGFSFDKSVFKHSAVAGVAVIFISLPSSCTSNVENATDTSDDSRSKTLMYTCLSTESGTALMLYTGSAMSQSTKVSISSRDSFEEDFVNRSRNWFRSSAFTEPRVTSPTETTMSNPRTSATVAP
mmetsp:Transcript_2516/g.8790  ORF Transcript_2516/g.8790 Transcript_2516/m.8790 type:complete len:282 (-) Transcript_2516:1531-2376(-)